MEPEGSILANIVSCEFLLLGTHFKGFLPILTVLAGELRMLRVRELFGADSPSPQARGLAWGSARSVTCLYSAQN